ncbi:MAG: helix-turn-helix transcriptional regulator [Pseudomonadota bacterium]
MKLARPRSLTEPRVTSGSERLPKPEDNATIFDGLADIAGAVGTSEFYERAVSLVASMLSCDRYLVIRYARFSKPEFLINTSMTQEAVDDYFSSYFRIDPLLGMVRNRVDQRVLTFAELKKKGSDTFFYDQLLRSAEIFDEIVVMLPTVGGVWTALCIDRNNKHFTKAEVNKVREIVPLLERLHDLHVEHCVFSWEKSYLNDSSISFMMVDSEGNPTVRNGQWENRITPECETTILGLSQRKPQGVESLESGHIVHWETVDHQNAVAPNGKVYLIEDPAPGYMDLTADDIVEKFAKNYGLTPRETEITGLILQGKPPSLIAKTMDLSVGTVRNHKHRLYYKLDITTERELFCMFFDVTIGKNGRL